MNPRDAILRRIRVALASEPEMSQPPVPVLWPPGTWAEPADLAGRFLEELQRVHGEGYRCASIADAQQHLVELANQPDIQQMAVVDDPLCHAVVAGLESDRLVWPDAHWDRAQLAALPLAVLPAEFLLADTGTAVLTPRSSAERLLCYLPTIAVLVAPLSRLVAHMSDNWDRLAQRAADLATRGEIVLVTGPSRTADIEKKLVLGAHGPKRLVVLMVPDGPIKDG